LEDDAPVMNIYEIAKKAGVSIATVSRVINNSPNVKQETKERVEAVLREYSYTPNAIARSLVTKATHTIGVLTSDVRDSYYANAIYTIEQKFRELGYNVILCNTGLEVGQKKEYLQIMLQKKVDGIILVGSVFKEKTNNRHIYDVAVHVPVVMLNSYLPGDNIYSIVCDDERAILDVVELLNWKGHQDIVYMYDVESFSGIAKIEGFKKGMKKNNLTFDNSNMIKVHQGIQGGYEGVERLESQRKRYTAILTSEDIIAVGVLKKLREMGKKVPHDVAVFGFNNSQYALCTVPELSTVDNKVNDMALGAVQILYDVLQGKQVTSKITVTPELVIRGSC
jgi:DNA-binding LacI/PurR family transcriptional regulator